MDRSRVEPAREPVWDHPRLEDSDRALTLAYAGRMAEIAGPYAGEPGIWGW